MLKQTLITLSSLVTAAAFAGTAPAPVDKQPQQIDPILAPTISYSNFSLEYSYISSDFAGIGGLELDGHGVQAGLEYSPIEHLYLALRGGWHDIDVEFAGFAIADFDYWNVNAGIGGYFPITPNIHIVGEVGASYADLSVSGFGGSTDDWGIYVTPHVRAKFGIFETHVGVIYNSNDLALAEWTGFARVLVEVVPNVDVYVGGTIGFEDDNTAFEDLYGLQAGVRIKF